MTEAPRVGKWIGAIYGDTPCLVAARRVFRKRFKTVDTLISIARNPEADAEVVHQLRVAVRRAEAALSIFESFCDERRFRRLRRFLRRLRRRSAIVRRTDVQRMMLSCSFDKWTARNLADHQIVHEHLEKERVRLNTKLVAFASESVRIGRRKTIRRLLKTGFRSQRRDEPDRDGETVRRVPYTLSALAAQSVPALIDSVREKHMRDQSDPAELHKLRISGKRLRYALEVFAGCFPARLKEEIYPAIEKMLERLGEINDLSELAETLERLRESRQEICDSNGNGAPHRNGSPGSSLVELTSHYRERHQGQRQEFLNWWASPDAFRLFDGLAEVVCRPGRRPAALRGLTNLTGRAASNAAHLTPGTPEIHEPVAGSWTSHRRVAAIDVGTNSVRLVVGEADPHVHFRVIEEMKDSTRLGSGVFRDGRMTRESMEASVRALERMKAVAEGCHVDRIRAVATSAVREASNRAEFVAMVERQTGIHLEVIDAEREARLAFSSVSNSFDLDDRRVAVVDIGGGSTEIILTSGGMIDDIHSLPLGAVRLTEMFEGRGDASDRFDELRRTIDRLILDRLNAYSYQPYLIIGTGGTFTSLARVALRHGSALHAGGRFPFALRGYELRYGEILYFLNMLRNMPLEERRKVPGLSNQRAEIIVAGACIVERLTGYFGIERVRIHDGGVRDGLLAEMIDEYGAVTEGMQRHLPGSLEAVRRFAERSRYDKDHSEHVAAFALRIFDQLAEQHPDSAGSWGRSESRQLLHAAALLHDVGIAVEFSRHHKHSYDMILHAELPGYTRRNVEVIANICRYHRGGGPKGRHVGFRRLGDDDQRRVLHLAGILRVADGLDGPHRQNVRDVTVVSRSESVLFEVAALDDPEANLRAAQRKADLFEAAFQTRAEFAWSPCPLPVEEVAASA